MCCSKLALCPTCLDYRSQEDVICSRELISDRPATPFLSDLIKVSKCPDYVVNKGHYFGTNFFKEEPPLSDDDKRALIHLLKTF